MITFTAVAAVPRPPRQHADAPAASEIAATFTGLEARHHRAGAMGEIPTSLTFANVAPLPGPLSPAGAALASFAGQRLEHPSKGPAGETRGATCGVVAPLFDRRLDVALRELAAAPVLTCGDWPSPGDLMEGFDVRR